MYIYYQYIFTCCCVATILPAGLSLLYPGTRSVQLRVKLQGSMRWSYERNGNHGWNGRIFRFLLVGCVGFGFGLVLILVWLGFVLVLVLVWFGFDFGLAWFWFWLRWFLVLVGFGLFWLVWFVCLSWQHDIDCWSWVVERGGSLNWRAVKLLLWSV